MKSLTEFAKKPQLIEIVLDDADIVEEFGEPVVFYIKDYVDITTYFDFYKAQAEERHRLNEVLNRLVLDKDGNPMLQPDEVLPLNLSVSVLAKINDNMGKSKTKPSMKETGNQPA